MPRHADDVDAQVRSRALGLLARREHSRRELARKLARVTRDKTLIEGEICRLAEQGLQSDERFAAALLRHRAERGYGPLRLLAEFREHDLDPAAIEPSAAAWREVASAALRKRFGASAPQTPRELARQVRFLQNRGFTGEQVRHALDCRDEGC